MPDSILYRLFFMVCMNEARQSKFTTIERFGWTALAFGALSNARKAERGR